MKLDADIIALQETPDDEWELEGYQRTLAAKSHQGYVQLYVHESMKTTSLTRCRFAKCQSQPTDTGARS